MKHSPIEYKKGWIAIALVITIFSTGIAFFPARAQASDADSPTQVAQDIISAVKDTISASVSQSLQVKEFSLDSIAWAISKMAIQSMTKSTVNWINSGFNGSPAFVTDLEGHLRNVADATAGNFLTQLSNNPALKSPFQSKIAQSVGALYYLSTSKDGFFKEAKYTLQHVVKNDQAFLAGDFKQGGWNAWYSAWTRPQNNPFGERLIALDALREAVNVVQANDLQKLGWGQGFYSWCGTDRSGSNSNANASTDGIDQVVVTSQVNPAEVCQNKDGTPGFIQTPGSVLQNLTNHTLNLSGDQLVSADEFNEIIGALMSQLVSQVVGATGLSGVSSASSGGTGYIDQAADPSQYTDPLNANNDVSVLSQDVATEIQKMNQYITDWGTIKTEAGLALAKSSGCLIATDAVTKATTEEGRATLTITALKKIQTELATSAVSGTPTFDSIKAEFTALPQNSSTPSATDLAYATNQSQETNGTLFTQLKQIATTGLCIP